MGHVGGNGSEVPPRVSRPLYLRLAPSRGRPQVTPLHREFTQCPWSTGGPFPWTFRRTSEPISRTFRYVSVARRGVDPPQMYIPPIMLGNRSQRALEAAPVAGLDSATSGRHRGLALAREVVGAMGSEMSSPSRLNRQGFRAAGPTPGFPRMRCRVPFVEPRDRYHGPGPCLSAGGWYC